MATREGARALGLEDEIGSIEPGKRADLILVERDAPHLAPDRDPWSTLVYAARGTDVRLTMVDGEVLVDGLRADAAGCQPVAPRLEPPPPSWLARRTDAGRRRRLRLGQPGLTTTRTSAPVYNLLALA